MKIKDVVKSILRSRRVRLYEKSSDVVIGRSPVMNVVVLGSDDGIQGLCQEVEQFCSKPNTFRTDQ